MSYNRSHARRLCTRAELELFEASLADSIRSLTSARLRGKIARARTLRDKYRDLLRRQKLASRARTGAKRGISGNANQRTEQKAKLFAEALARFDARRVQLERTQAAAAAQRQRKVAANKGPRARQAGARLAAKRASRAGKGYSSRSAETAARRGELAASRSRPIQAHIRSRGRRAQARRDGRR